MPASRQTEVVSTGYVIFRMDRATNGDPKMMVAHVVWRAEQAADMVNRLNALATDGAGRYSWEEVWVDRPDAEAGVSLTPDDHEKLGFAQKHGALDTERPVSVFFSFTFNLPGARKASDELDTFGWPDVSFDEESTGDECWHVWGLGRRLILNEVSITRLRTEMESLAERHGGTFDGWDVTGGPGLRWTEPGKLPT
jgi:hypothetical protein